MNDREDIKITEKTEPNPLIRWGIFAAIVLIAFLIGLIPMMMQKWSVESELAAVQNRLRQSEIKGLLTGAIVEANRGEYEPARQNASNFFTRLNEEQEKGNEGFLTETERGNIKPVFDARDTIITMLAQRDPAAVERLSNVYSTYLQATGVAQPPTTAPAATTPAATAPATNSGQ